MGVHVDVVEAKRQKFAGSIHDGVVFF